jgi:hypothetical protein
MKHVGFFRVIAKILARLHRSKTFGLCGYTSIFLPQRLRGTEGNKKGALFPKIFSSESLWLFL